MWVSTDFFPCCCRHCIVKGAEDEIDAEGKIELTELNGIPITSAVGTTPLETWGHVLTKLGLVDEIMLESALEAVLTSRREGFQEAKDKMEGRTIESKSTPPKPRSGAPSPVPSTAASAGNNNENGAGPKVVESDQKQPQANDKEPPTQREQELREEVEALLSELGSAQEADRQAAIALANSRINTLGRFLCNPFHDEASGKSQQASWLATAVRKEKTRMGSTGNRKKVVTATDLLERNDTMYNADIEALIEGLPGSEHCKSYVFQAFRSGGSTALTNRSWIHEAQLRQEKEAMKRQQRSREVREREEAKNLFEQEKAKKRRKKEEVRDARKKQKMEEEDEKKRARIEERLGRLRLTIEDRLFKEASTQRDKVVATFARSLAKEFARRRKAAEVLASQRVIETNALSAASVSSVSPPYVSELPHLSQPYDEDAVRVWNFISTFKNFFLERGYMSEIPTLDSLQTSINCLRGGATKSTLSPEEAIASLTDLAVALCKPLAASLTRVLFASLIALNPILQRDFGAAFFNEVNAKKSKEDTESEDARPDVVLPVNSMTWQEIARLTFLADALGELSFSRHEVAHILRGYRSAGHPNSKEARRLRQAEDFAVVLLRQAIAESRLKRDSQSNGEAITRAVVPCKPLCSPDDFRFYLHNLISLDEATAGAFKKNLGWALKLLKDAEEPGMDAHRKKIERIIGQIEDASSSDHPTKAESKSLKKAKDVVSNVFNEVAGLASDKFAADAATGQIDTKWPWEDRTRRKKDDGRGQMGLLNTLVMTAADYKRISHAREHYMEAALRLKEELERQKRKDEDEEDDDDDEDDDDGNGATKAVVVENGSASVGAELAKTSGGTPVTDPTKPPPVSSSEVDSKPSSEPKKIGKETPYDEFCSDIPTSPELIRRCLAVLRTLCMTGCAELFLYPVDPQTNPAYYDSLLHPMCLQEVGAHLHNVAKKNQGHKKVSNEQVEAAVAQFGRNVRLIGQNCLCYANAGPTVISAGSELLRIFERLLLDWVLAPEDLLPPLEELDDDRCVHHHASDAESTVLLCDGCEGKYNIARLDPPLHDIPKGDWYCPRCVQGRWWGHLDPRIGKSVRDFVEEDGRENKDMEGVVRKCMFSYPEGVKSKPSLMYKVEFEDGEETWTLLKVDQALAQSGNPVTPIRCLEAVAESVGYSFGVDHGLRQDLVPVPSNPNVSDAAGQVALSSSVFRDTIAASGTLLVIDPRNMTASEWLRLLVLLVMKCASSDVVQSIIGKMESEAAERMAGPLQKLGKVSKIIDVIPPIDEWSFATEAKEEERSPDSDKAMAEGEIGEKKQSAAPASTLVSVPAPVVEASAVEVFDEMDVEVDPEKTVSSAEVTAKPDEDSSAAKVDRFAAALFEKKKRQKLIEDSFAAYSIKNHVRSTVASFEEDTVSQVIDASLASQSSPLNFANLRCRRMVCTFCGLTDVALGLPLVRVPNEAEWDELIPHAARYRQVYLVAEIPLAESLVAGSESSGTLVSVKLRVGDEIVSAPCDAGDCVVDGGMLDFAPRSSSGFQDELRFRDKVSLPFVTGSLSAHECCAVSAHNSRKDQMVQRYKHREAEIIEKDFGMECGRTLEIGRDGAGRSFWKFFSEPSSLFVCSESGSGATSTWQCFPDPESIASVMVSLGKDRLVKDLQRSYPKAFQMVTDGTWSDALLKRQFPQVAAIMAGNASDVEEEEPVLAVEGGFEVGHIYRLCFLGLFVVLTLFVCEGLSRWRKCSR